jgi:hypothetical protein
MLEGSGPSTLPPLGVAQDGRLGHNGGASMSVSRVAGRLVRRVEG